MGQYNHLANSFLPDEREAGSVGEQREPATCSGGLLNAGGEIVFMFVSFFCGKIVLMFVSSLFCCLSFFNIGPVLIVDRNNDVFSQAMLEETLTKNLHLQQDLEHMSQVTIIVFFG